MTRPCDAMGLPNKHKKSTCTAMTVLEISASELDAKFSDSCGPHLLQKYFKPCHHSTTVEALPQYYSYALYYNIEDYITQDMIWWMLQKGMRGYQYFSFGNCQDRRLCTSSYLFQFLMPFIRIATALISSVISHNNRQMLERDYLYSFFGNKETPERVVCWLRPCDMMHQPGRSQSFTLHRTQAIFNGLIFNSYDGCQRLG